MKNYNFKRRSFSSGPHLLGLLLVMVGLLSIVSLLFFKSSSSLERSILIGVGAIIPGLMLASSYGGTLLDFNRKRVKEYSSFMGYKFGQWLTLPTITQIAVIPVKHKATNTSNGISPTWFGTVTHFKVFLYSNSPTAVLLFTFSNKERAVADAKHLSANLSAKIEVKVSEEA